MTNMIKILQITQVIPVFLYLYSISAVANSFTLPDNGDNVLGRINTVTATQRDTLLDIARQHGLGYQDITLANPHTDTWLPGENTTVILPGQFILPHTPRNGLVLNIPEMRLYYFNKPSRASLQPEVTTYPLGIGREGWSTPFVITRIISKHEKPKWYPPQSIRQEALEQGRELPAVVEAGPDNPLGDHALRLGLPSYLVHGTNKPWGVGLRVSHGCIRLYPEDIAQLYKDVAINTRVQIVNQPYKIGVLNGIVYLEAHPLLAEAHTGSNNNLTEVVKLVIKQLPENQFVIDWSVVKTVIDDSNGMPVAIGSITQCQEENCQEDDFTKTSLSMPGVFNENRP